MKRPVRFLRFLSLAGPLWVAVFIYDYTLTMPLFLDDGPQLRIVDSLSLAEPWGGTFAYHYYRPAVFSIWKLNALINGFFEPVGLHFLNVIAFGMTGVLLGVITRRLAPSGYAHLAGGLAGLSFVSFPRAYQAVILVGALYHIMVLLCAAAVIWLALKWMDHHGGPAIWLAAMLFGFVGVFSHENGVMIVLLVVIIMMFAHGWRAVFTRHALLLLLPLAALTLAFVYQWATVPRSRLYGEVQNLDDIWWNAGMLWHGLVYPLGALARWLNPNQESTALIIALVVGATIAMSGLLGGRKRAALKLFGVGLVWYALGALPAMLLLEPGYTNGSPRLMLFSIGGASLVWGVSLAALLRDKLPFKLLSVGIMAGSIYVGVVFLGRMENWGGELTDYMRRLEDYSVTQSRSVRDGGMLLVNAPNYIIPHEEDRVFLRGGEGVAFMFFNINYNDQLWINTENYPDLIHAGVYEQTLRYTGASFNAHGDVQDTQRLAEVGRSAKYIYVTHFNADGFTPVYVGAGGLPGDNERDARFGDLVSLLQGEYTYSPQREALTVLLRWQVDLPVPSKPFLHAVCDGAIIAQSDADPWGEIFPFALWFPGEIQTELREIPLPQAWDAERCELLLGVYTLPDVQRLPIALFSAPEARDDDRLPLPYSGENDSIFPYLG